MLRNGDGHLKNFGVSYDSQSVWLAPIYDLVATVLYPYERGNGTVVVDRTMALRLRRGKGSRAYPQFDELLSFGRDICAVADPGAVIERLRAAIADTLDAAQSDERISRSLIEPLAAVWTASLAVYRS